MGKRMKAVYPDEDDDRQTQATWDEEDLVGGVHDEQGGKGARPKRRKTGKTKETNTSSSDDGGVAVVAAEGSSPLTKVSAATLVDPRERHKLAERERRKSMRELFLSLHALLPNGDTVRKEQSAILDEIIKYIPIAASRLRSLRIDAQRRRRPKRCKDNCVNDPENQEAAGDESPNYTGVSSSSTSSSSSSLSSSSSSSSSEMTATAPIPNRTNIKCPTEASNAVSYYACHSRSGSTNSLTNLATGSPLSGRSRKPRDRSTTLPLPDDCCSVDIQVAPEPATSVSIRLRGDRVNVSLTDHFYAKQTTASASFSAQPFLLLSAVLDELEAHQLDVIRSTHCRDGSKLLHYSESKIQVDQKMTDGPLASASPEILKSTLQHLASKLQALRKSTIIIATCASTT